MRDKRSSRRAKCVIEPLESRTHLSISPAVATPRELTTTTVKVNAGTFGQAITLTATVRTAVKFGNPVGTVDFLDNGNLIQEVALTSITSPLPRFAESQASYTIPAGAGGTSFYIGAHRVTATFNNGSTFVGSKGAAVFAVRTPKYTRASDGVKTATIFAGSGAAIQPGQTATMMYTGYLATNGSIFDESSAHSPGTFDFVVEDSPEQVIPGFDQGVVGMQVGETRAIYIPFAQGYGTTGAGTAVPPRTNIVFLVTLVAIS